jgi:outer membrane lipoprotein-sorting protein
MLALLAAFLIQDSAVDLLKQVEDKYASAKSFSVTVEIKGTGKKAGRELKTELRATFQSKGERMARIELSGKANGREVPKTRLVSDGRRLEMTDGMGPAARQDHKAPLGTLTRRLHVRASLVFSIGAVAQASKLESLDVGKLISLVDIADGGREKVDGRECRIVTFTAGSPEMRDATLKCRLWIDAEKRTIVRRESTLTGGGETGTIMETYLNPVFDADLSDDVFKIPD